MKTMMLVILGIIMVIIGLVLSDIYYPYSLLFNIIGGTLAAWNCASLKIKYRKK